MKNIVMVAALAGTAAVASADVLLTVDLSVVNQVTITATAGLSAATATGGTGTGIYLQGFWTGPGTTTSVGGNGTGTFRTVNGSVGDGTPALYRFNLAETGLNIWSFATTATFTTGQQAFSGSGTWTLSAAAYADMLANGGSGNLYFPADDASDLPNAQLLGTWQVVPTPGAAAMLGLSGLMVTRRRRA